MLTVLPVASSSAAFAPESPRSWPEPAPVSGPHRWISRQSVSSYQFTRTCGCPFNFTMSFLFPSPIPCLIVFSRFFLSLVCHVHTFVITPVFVVCFCYSSRHHPPPFLLLLFGSSPTLSLSACFIVSVALFALSMFFQLALTFHHRLLSPLFLLLPFASVYGKGLGSVL